MIIEIILFDIEHFRRYLRLSPIWYHYVLEAMDDYFNEVENKFVMMYHEYFNFHSSYTSS